MGCYLSPLGNLPYISDHSIIVWAGILIAQLFNRSGARVWGKKNRLDFPSNPALSKCLILQDIIVEFFPILKLGTIWCEYINSIAIQWLEYNFFRISLLSTSIVQNNCKVIIFNNFYINTKNFDFNFWRNLLFLIIFLKFLFADIPWCVDHCLFLPDGHRNRCHFAQC